MNDVKTIEEAISETRARLHAAAAGAATAQTLLDSAVRLLEDEVRTARETGVSWSMIAYMTGQTEAQLAWIVKRNEERVGKTALPRQPLTMRPVVKNRPALALRGPGMSVVDYAATQGVTRLTVYNWAKKGYLQTAKNHLGQLRILGKAEATEG